MSKANEDTLNPCGHRNSARLEALKEFPSAICPACLIERIKELEAEIKRRKYHTKNALHYYKINKPKEMMGAFEQSPERINDAAFLMILGHISQTFFYFSF